jgi:hypothetical protein
MSRGRPGAPARGCPPCLREWRGGKKEERGDQTSENGLCVAYGPRRTSDPRSSAGRCDRSSPGLLPWSAVTRPGRRGWGRGRHPLHHRRLPVEFEGGEGKSVSAVISEALCAQLAKRQTPLKTAAFRLVTVKGGGRRRRGEAEEDAECPGLRASRRHQRARRTRGTQRLGPARETPRAGPRRSRVDCGRSRSSGTEHVQMPAPEGDSHG